MDFILWEALKKLWTSRLVDFFLRNPIFLQALEISNPVLPIFDIVLKSVVHGKGPLAPCIFEQALSTEGLIDYLCSALRVQALVRSNVGLRVIHLVCMKSKSRLIETVGLTRMMLDMHWLIGNQLTACLRCHDNVSHLLGSCSSSCQSQVSLGWLEPTWIRIMILCQCISICDTCPALRA